MAFETRNTSTGEYSWLRSARILMLDVFNPPMYPGLELDAEHLVSVMEALSANAVRLPAVGAYAYYRSQIVPQHPEMGRRDVIGEAIEACHLRGFKAIAYCGILQAKVELLRLWGHEDDWAAVHKDGSPILLSHGTGKTNSDIVVLCPRSGAREAMQDYVRELVSIHDIDTAYFDGPVTVIGAYPDGFCHCSRCRDAFEEEEGVMPPDSELYDWAAPLSIRHCLWQRRDGVMLLADLYDDVKGIAEIPVIFNWLDHAAGRLSRGTDIVRHSDGFLVEAGEDFASKMYTSKLGSSMDRIVLSYVGNYNPWSRSRVGNAEIYQEGCSIVAGGGTPIVASGASCYYNPENSESVKRLFDFVREHEDVLHGADQVKFIALPHSQYSSDWHIMKKAADQYDFLGDGRGGYYEVYHQGMSRILSHSHMQFNPVSSWALADGELLRQYPIVVLSNVACMSDKEAEAIEDYVAGGGNLLATYETSLYDKHGRRREDFALADVFGVRFKSQAGLVFEKYLSIPQSGPSSLLPFPAYPIPAVEFNIVDLADEAEVVAEILDGKTPIGPGIILRRYGKGKVAYIASGIERVYQDGGIGSMSPRATDFLVVFSNLIGWLSDGELPFGIEANRGVFANLTASNHAYFLHLINYNMPNLERPHCQIDDPVPVTGISCRVRLLEGAKARGVILRASGEQLGFLDEGSVVSFKVPQLATNEIAEITLG